MDDRSTRHARYAPSINARKRIKPVLAWIKQSAGLRQLEAGGRSRVGVVLLLHVVVHSLIRLANLLRPRQLLA